MTTVIPSDTTCWAEIHHDALRHNARLAKNLAPQARLMAMIKGDGYGHGLLETAGALTDIADGFAVARLQEATALRAHEISHPVLLLGTLLDDQQLLRCAELRLDLVIHDIDTAQRLASSTLPCPVNVWLKLNTGMNRLGMSEEDFQSAHHLLEKSPQVAEILHMTHFSSADEADKAVTAGQIQRLKSTSAGLGDYPLSMANSAGIIAHPDSHAGWNRPGIMLYGDNPARDFAQAELRQVMQFKASVIALHTLKAGDKVGYNQTWTAPGYCRIAVLGVGYADGYPRHARNGTPVLINGERAALAGRVSMDIISVDISALKQPVQLGDEALLWGEGLPAWEIAAAAETISYQLYTGVTARVPKIYR